MSKCYDMPFYLSTKMHTIVTHRKKVAVVSLSGWGRNRRDGRIKSETKHRQLPLYCRSLQGQVIGSPVYQMRSSLFHRLFGPPGAGIPSRRSSPRGCIEPKEPANRATEVDTSATGNPNVRSQPGRKGEGVPRVRHRLKRFCRRSASRGAPLPAALSAGFAGNSQRTLSHRFCSPQSVSNCARAISPRNPR